MSRFLQSSRALLRIFAVASFALCIVAPSFAQQRRPISSPLDRWVFEGGGGFTAPAGGTSNVINYGYNLMGGVGFKESRYLSTIGEFQYDSAGIANSELIRQQFPDGHRSIISLTVEQKVNLEGTPTHLYLIGGGGWYHQRTTFTEPGGPIICDPFTGLCFGGGDIILSQFSTDQAGFNAGAGFEHRLSQYSNAKLFVEARYTYLDTPAHATQVVPVTFGLRF
jgi:Outer membrane protein beta-barrel domain